MGLGCKALGPGTLQCLDFLKEVQAFNGFGFLVVIATLTRFTKLYYGLC